LREVARARRAGFPDRQGVRQQRAMQSDVFHREESRLINTPSRLLRLFRSKNRAAPPRYSPRNPLAAVNNFGSNLVANSAF
jgi:hypothetical protein